jgi:hypothetical protein
LLAARIDRFITEDGKGPYSQWSEQVSGLEGNKPVEVDALAVALRTARPIATLAT